MIKLFIITIFSALLVTASAQTTIASPRLIPVRAIDTMKISRDIAREKLNDSTFDLVIADHMEKIAGMGVTHVVINTPYDDEFLPLMRRWVSAARVKRLKVWYRGNFSGWEGWFNYPDISRVEHHNKLKRFLENNPDLFQNGDIFTACMECENGDPNNPFTGDLNSFRKFMIDEYTTMNTIFARQKKNIITNYNSMNGELALRFYDKATTTALGGVIGIDHYVSSPEKLINDIRILAKSSGGKVVIGELGIPIPDIHGTKMPPKEQAEWMAVAFAQMQNMPEVIAVNYWTSWGGSTALWSNTGQSSEVAKVVKNFFTGTTRQVKLQNQNNQPITDATIKTFETIAVKENKNGVYQVPYLYTGQKIQVVTKNADTQEKTLTDAENNLVIVLASEVEPKKELSWWEKFIGWLRGLLGFKN